VARSPHRSVNAGAVLLALNCTSAPGEATPVTSSRRRTASQHDLLGHCHGSPAATVRQLRFRGPLVPGATPARRHGDLGLGGRRWPSGDELESMAIGDQLDQGGEQRRHRRSHRRRDRRIPPRPAGRSASGHVMQAGSVSGLGGQIGVEAVQWSWALASRSMAQHECHLTIRPRSPHDGKCARAVPTAIDTWGT
jgi:hypothetical protein